MTSREDPEHISSNAPLLSSDESHGDRYHDTEDEVLPAPIPATSDGWFIWFLTFSAGISGLLFGYECVGPIIVFRISVTKEIAIQHRRDFLHTRDNWLRPF